MMSQEMSPVGVGILLVNDCQHAEPEETDPGQDRGVPPGQPEAAYSVIEALLKAQQYRRSSRG